MSIELMKTIKKRRSTRKYKNEKVLRDYVLELIEAGIYAPSGSNIQPWQFIIVEKPEIINNIRAFAPGLMGNPPNLIIVCRDLKKAFNKGGEFGRDELSIIDISMAAQNILLLATEKGISTCIVKSYNKEAIEKILGIPNYISADIIISLGYSETNCDAPQRRSVKECTYLNKWGGLINE